ncbi:hypothetical protein ILUMI_12884 [Ignelater luminosus]|uniref:Uncharacterized protein n=1 Tax=Ignelater luminosus TaxID=2038154 RepID=A0A8K0CTA1_IGNLU|nr:hypothetical protein ILUMI_12884 [Ignelater luminosus]
MLLDTTHLYKLLESSKLIIFGTDEIITFLLKIPVIKPLTANYFQIYPLPNHQEIILIPPGNYYLEIANDAYWTNEKCKPIHTYILCTERTQLLDNCTLQSLPRCTTAKISNNYEISVQLRNHQLLTAFKHGHDVIEDCHGHITRRSITGTNLLSSTCRVIIGSSTYDNTTPIFEIDVPRFTPQLLDAHHQVPFNLKHLRDSKELHLEAIQIADPPIHLQPATYFIHYSFTSILVIITIVATVLAIKFRVRLYTLFRKPTRVIRIKKIKDPHPEMELQTLTGPQAPTLYPTLNVDVQSSRREEL